MVLSNTGGSAAAGVIVCCNAKGVTRLSRTSKARASCSTSRTPGAAVRAATDVARVAITSSRSHENYGISASNPTSSVMSPAGRTMSSLLLSTCSIDQARRILLCGGGQCGLCCLYWRCGLSCLSEIAGGLTTQSDYLFRDFEFLILVTESFKLESKHAAGTRGQFAADGPAYARQEEISGGAAENRQCFFGDTLQGAAKRFTWSRFQKGPDFFENLAEEHVEFSLVLNA